MKPKQLTRIAFMAASLVCVFQLFSNILYLELITFTILLYANVFPKKEAILSCMIFGLLNMLFMGFNPWTCMYLNLYPIYAWIISCFQGVLKRHPLCLCLCCGILSFLTGQLLDLPYVLLSRNLTILYILMGLKTSLVQGILSFIVCLFLYDPLAQRLSEIVSKQEHQV